MKAGVSSAPAAQLATDAARATQSGIPRQVVFLPTCVNRCGLCALMFFGAVTSGCLAAGSVE